MKVVGEICCNGEELFLKPLAKVSLRPTQSELGKQISIWRCEQQYSNSTTQDDQQPTNQKKQKQKQRAKW